MTSKNWDWKMPTDMAIAAMLTEPTGVSFLDSGGESGRGWQRRARMTVEDFRARPAAYAEVFRSCGEDGRGDGYVELDTFHYLSAKLTICQPLTNGLRGFGKAASRVDELWLTTMQAYVAKRVTGDPDADEKEIKAKLAESGNEYFDYLSFNSYNSENCLSSEIQGIAYRDPRYGPVVVLHTHNGADVRGGYSSPRVFEISTDEPWDLFDWCSYSVVCTRLGSEEQVREARDAMLPGLADATGEAWSEVHVWDTRHPYDWSDYGGRCMGDPWEETGKPKWHKSDGSDSEAGTPDSLLCPACSAPAEVYPR